jgi:hypothetical protein
MIMVVDTQIPVYRSCLRDGVGGLISISKSPAEKHSRTVDDCMKESDVGFMRFHLPNGISDANLPILPALGLGPESCARRTGCRPHGKCRPPQIMKEALGCTGTSYCTKPWNG